MAMLDDDNISSAGSDDESTEQLSSAVVMPHQTYAEMFYISQGRSLKALATLCQGLVKDDGCALFDPSILPWSSVGKLAVKLTAADLRAEVSRRAVANLNVDVVPRPEAWTVTRAIEWLNANPVTGDEEISFIKTTLIDCEKIAELAAQEQADKLRDNSGGGGGGNWTGKYPMLRLIHALIDHDNVKRAYLTRHDLPSGRMAIENRNTAEARASTVWQLMADKWNDPLFLPTTAVRADTHSDFARPLALSFELVSHMQPATADKVEERWNSMILALNCAIQNWECSGQGDGGSSVIRRKRGGIDEEDSTTSSKIYEVK